jgi:hypothetical protein
VVTICTKFSIHKFYVLHTHCICVFSMDLRTNSDYFPIPLTCPAMNPLLLWWWGLWFPVTMRTKSVVALLPVGCPKPDSPREYEPDEKRWLGYGNSNRNSSDAGNSDTGTDMKHRANDAADGSWSQSNRRDQSGFQRPLYMDVETKWKNYHIILIVVFPCMLTIIQLLLQQNAHVFLLLKSQDITICNFVLYFCPYTFQSAWVIFRGLNASAWLKLLLITIY